MLHDTEACASLLRYRLWYHLRLNLQYCFLRRSHNHLLFAIAEVADLISHLGVDRADLVVDFLVHSVLLLVSCVLLHASLEALHDGLSLAEVSSSRHVCGLLHAVIGEHFEVCLSLHCFSFIADFLLLGDHAEAFRSVKGSVCNLCLEGEVSYLCHVEVFHF